MERGESFRSSRPISELPPPANGPAKARGEPTPFARMLASVMGTMGEPSRGMPAVYGAYPTPQRHPVKSSFAARRVILQVIETAIVVNRYCARNQCYGCEQQNNHYPPPFHLLSPISVTGRPLTWRDPHAAWRHPGNMVVASRMPEGETDRDGARRYPSRPQRGHDPKNYDPKSPTQIIIWGPSPLQVHSSSARSRSRVLCMATTPPPDGARQTDRNARS
jgi:hypothetical protein